MPDGLFFRLLGGEEDKTPASLSDHLRAGLELGGRTHDLRKEYAKKIEYMGTVRDGSKKELCNGYWTLNIIACEAGDYKITPLYQSLYSSSAPDFSSENSEILTAVDMITERTNKRGILVIDRGGDRQKLINPFLNKGLQFIIRIVGDRHLTFRGRNRLAEDLAKGCPLWYRETIIKLS